MQEAIVAVIVACSVWVIAKCYLPKAVRQAVRQWIADLLKKLGWYWMANRLAVQTPVSTVCSSGCGTCGGCGSDATVSDKKQSTITLKTLRRVDSLES